MSLVPFHPREGREVVLYVMPPPLSGHVQVPSSPLPATRDRFREPACFLQLAMHVR